MTANACTDSATLAAAERFRDLHAANGCFVMPNAWDVGSARLLAGMGFEALGSTSAGLALTRGHADQAALLPLDDTLANVAAMAHATPLPVSADFENGYADAPEQVAENIRRVAAAGAAGASIEDHTGSDARGLYEIEFAVERVAAAAEAARGLDRPFVLTARAECYLVGHEDAFRESLRRLQRFAEVGADCVYAPGVRDRDEIRVFVADAGAPVNVLVGMPGMNATLDEMRDLGVRRLSTGGSLMRATLAPLIEAAKEMQAGRFTFPDRAVPEADAVALMEKGGA